jgi:hypothetical protein
MARRYEYYVSGLQCYAHWVVLHDGTLRFTPGSGNLYVANNCFDYIGSVIADTLDRNGDPKTFPNTPESFVLRKSGSGKVVGLISTDTISRPVR